MGILSRVNGLLDEANSPTVLFKKNNRSGICYVKVHVDSGSSSETNESHYGIAHYLEHMIFKGTTKTNSRELSRTLSKLGRNNAYTYFDGTAYHLTCLKENWKPSLKILTDMVFNPALPEKEFKTERGVILEEFQMYNSDINVRRQWNEFQSLFGEKAHPVIGSQKSIENMDHGDLVEFHKNHYTLGNTTFCVCGDIDEKEFADEIRSLVRGVPISEALKPQLDDFVNLEAMDLETKNPNQGSMTMYFDLGLLKDFKKRIAVADLHQMVLGGGSQSMLFEGAKYKPSIRGFLNESLREDHGLCYSVSADHYGFFDRAVSIISTSLNPKNIGKAISPTYSLLASSTFFCKA